MPYSEGNITAKRNYLAERAAAGDWKPTKPLNQYTNQQVARKYHNFQEQTRAGEDISNQAARGHGRTEHGKPSAIAKQRASVAAPQPTEGAAAPGGARPTREAPWVGAERWKSLGGEKGVYTGNARLARDAVIDAAENGQRVVIRAWDDQTGKVVTVYSGKTMTRGQKTPAWGISADHLLERIEDDQTANGGSFEDALRRVVSADASSPAHSNPQASLDWQHLKSFQVYVMSSDVTATRDRTRRSLHRDSRAAQ